MNRRSLVCFAGAASCIGLPAPSFAQDRKPIRLIVPFPAGGPTDVVARLLTDPLGKRLGQSVFVDNRPGSGGAAGTVELARSSPDGLTLGIASVSTHAVNPAVKRRAEYDPLKDFAAIIELVKAPVALVVHPALGINSVDEFRTYLKKNPGKLSYGSPGAGTTGHMLGELFKSATNTFMLHIPYSGTGPAMADLLSGKIDANFDQVMSGLAHVKSGKLRALAVSWPRRLDVLPDVATFAEAGLYANNHPSWFGLVAAAKTQQSEIERINRAVRAVIADTAMTERFGQLGLFASGGSSADFANVIVKEFDRMRRVAKFANISLA